MRRLLPAVVLAVVLATAAASCSAAPPAHRTRPPVTYYLSLGDSLARGVQPDAAGASIPTPHGYADQLYAALAPRHPGLRLVKLGCSGETTATMINGGICRYQDGSQLASAIRFLRAHRGRIWLVTLDIGANDPGSCLTRPTLGKLAACVRDVIPHATANLTAILTRLRRADPRGRIVAMNYYLPALAEWRGGLPGEAVARVSEVAAAGYQVIARAFQRAGAR